MIPSKSNLLGITFLNPKDLLLNFQKSLSSVLKMILANVILDWFMYKFIEAKLFIHAAVELTLLLYIVISLILWLTGIDSRKRKNETILAVALLILFEIIF